MSCIFNARNRYGDIVNNPPFDLFQVYLSHLNKRYPFAMTSNVHQIGALSLIKTNSVLLEDGCEVDVDTILLCTGYAYSFPFLDDKCGVTVDRDRISPLYKHLIHTQYPNLCIPCIGKATLPFPHIDHQIRFFLATLDGSVVLPSKEEMDADTRADYKRRLGSGMPHRYAHRMGKKFLREYHTDLSKLSDIRPIPPVIFNIFDYVIDRLVGDYTNFKNDSITIIDDERFESKRGTWSLFDNCWLVSTSITQITKIVSRFLPQYGIIWHYPEHVSV